MAAIALYRAAGMEVVHEVHVLRLSRAQLEQFAGPRSARFAVLPVAPADDAALEAQYDLGAGQLAQLRARRPHARMWRLADGGDTLGLARYWHEYAPDCGVVFPFRAAGADAAAHLLSGALGGLTLAAEIELPVVDAPVAAALVAAGARRHEHMLEMGGPLG